MLNRKETELNELEEGNHEKLMKWRGRRGNDK